jgi:hypothetical protein
MKKIATLATLALITKSSFAVIFTESFTGSFTSGNLTGITINGFIEIDDKGLFSGTADTNPLTTGDGSLLDLSFDFGDGLGDTIFFDLFDDLEPLATFSGQSFVGLDYFGNNFNGEQLDILYDAFAEDALSGISVVFEDFGGNISRGTLNLPTAVPEPSTYAAILGALALGVTVLRRRQRN